MHLVLSALMLILFDFSHLSRYFSSLFISSAESITLSPGTQVESVLSSAYRMYLNWLEHFVISYMKIKNRRGPKIDPCGTPHWISLWIESTLFIYTYCSLFVRYERNQSKTVPRTSQVFNFDSRISWLTQWNALQNPGTKKIVSVIHGEHRGLGGFNVLTCYPIYCILNLYALPSYDFLLRNSA